MKKRKESLGAIEGIESFVRRKAKWFLPLGVVLFSSWKLETSRVGVSQAPLFSSSYQTRVQDQTRARARARSPAQALVPTQELAQTPYSPRDLGSQRAPLGNVSTQTTQSTLEPSAPSSPPSPSLSRMGESRTLEVQAPALKTNTVKDEPQMMLNDPKLAKAWGTRASDAPRAWEVSQGSRKVVVAIIDTGADVYHEDLRENIWVNAGEVGKDRLGRNKATNEIDDDNNGFVDDVHGFNFASNTGDLTDTHGHGTHVAGVIGAVGGNGKGIVGMAPHVSLMILKYYDPSSSSNLANSVRAIRYAIKNKANIINYSGGGTQPSTEERTALEEARQAGILVVAAAGNERANSDTNKYYPAGYGLSNIISVGAIDQNVEIPNFSNYGVQTVDISAPGQNILSTTPNNTYGYLTGTSQATAFVTGAAALIMAYREDFDPEDVKKYILSTGDLSPQLRSKTKTARQLNMYKALVKLDEGFSAFGLKIATANLSQHRKIMREELEDFQNEDLAAGSGSGSGSKTGSNASFSGFSSSFSQFGKDLNNVLLPKVKISPQN